MSDETPRADTRDGAGRVIGTFLTLALFLGALAWTAKGLLVSPVDGAARQRQLFGEKKLPFGLALESAVRLPTGDALVRFRRADGDASGPHEVIFLEYRSQAAAAALFRPTMEGPPMGMEGGGAGGRLREWEKDKAFDWHFTMKRSEIAWGEWSSRLWIERSFKKGGGWNEEARVDLSTPKQGLVLFAHWPEEKPADEKELRELLLAIELAPPGV